ncbi:MAG TPA: hypothetical protein VM695_06220 [Phycisphaerae bacterium]|jgi:hypothetical protein|nr:hypothetical protein [Phycisphaerae bacterium]
MDRKKIIEWITAAVARGVAWVLAAKLGLDATEAEGHGATIAGAVVGLVVVGISIYSSIKGRKRLLEAQPPQGT